MKEKMKIDTDYKEMELEFVEWFSSHYGHLTDFVGRYDGGEDLFISSAPGADPGCVWIGFAPEGQGPEGIGRNEILIPLSAVEYYDLFGDEKEDEEWQPSTYSEWCSYHGVSPRDF